jgi:hypothetical protein
MSFFYSRKRIREKHPLNLHYTFLSNVFFYWCLLGTQLLDQQALTSGENNP